MPDDLYFRDALAWAEQQAALLRRLARGERVNDVDWDHVVEEIEDVGLSQLSAVSSYLSQLLIHLLKLQGWPGSDAASHWRNELGVFQAEASQRFAPSMRQRIDVEALFLKARRVVERMQIDGTGPVRLADAMPFTLDDLLEADPRDLAVRISLVGPPEV